MRSTSAVSSTCSSITWSRLQPLRGQHGVERLGLRHGARKAIEDEALAAYRSRRSGSAIRSIMMSSETSWPASMIAWNLLPERAARGALGAQHVAGRQAGPGRGAPPGAWPGCPCRPRAAPAESGSPASPPQLRLFDQAFILMREEMRMDLRHRIHGDADDDQQAGAAEIERHGVLRRPGFPGSTQTPAR